LDLKNNFQQTLNLELKNKYLREDYIITGSNKNAYNAGISNIIGYAPMPNILVIKGEKSSGKTFLANVISDICDARIIDNIEDSFVSGSEYLILDNSEKISENQIFHLINFACNNSKKLLLFFCSSFNPELPDLKSRIMSIRTENIDAPDEEMVELYMLSIFSKKSLTVPIELINYLKVRLPRNFNKISEFINNLDEFCLKTKKNLTVKSASILLSDIS